MQSEQKDRMKTHCPYCDTVTTCNILDKHNSDNYIEPGEGWVADTFTYALKCCGCEKPFILERTVSVWSDIDCNGNFVPDEKTFPKVPSLQHRALRDDLDFSASVDKNKGRFASQLYHEIINAINADSLIIAALGMRSLLDTACQIKLCHHPVENSEKQKTKNFAENLKELHSAGHITEEHKKILSDILELGHGATHRQTKASRDKILSAIHIVECILDSLFTVPKLGEKLNG